MDKEDCIQVLLAALRQPRWKSCDSVTDWDLKNVLWKAGLLLTPEQVAALFADIKRRGLISGQIRRIDDRVLALWGIKLTQTGEEWLSQRAQMPVRQGGTVPWTEMTEDGEASLPSLVGEVRQDTSTGEDYPQLLPEDSGSTGQVASQPNP